MLGNVSDGVAEPKALVDRFNEVCAAMGQPDADFDKLLSEQAELQDKIDAAGAWDLERTFEIAMDALRCPPGDADVTTLSGGERRRVEIARSLAIDPSFLLLDEPFSGIDPIQVIELQRIILDLKSDGLGILVTDHNVRETLSVTDRAYIIETGADSFRFRRTVEKGRTKITS